MIATGFTGSPLDRADALRQDEGALAAALRDPAARSLRLDGLEPAVGDDDALVWDPVATGHEHALLGLAEGAPRFVALTAPDGAEPSGTLFDRITRMRAGDAATFAGARSLVDWHRRHRFCANCGAGTTVFRAGWGRRCGACATEHFPRVDPVVIMIAEHDGRALLGRQPRFPERRYSALAGFLEPGESIEEAVARELLEEAGVRVTDIRYVASQPWPFPASLMIACMARALDDRLTIDATELEDAAWFTRAEVRSALAGEADAVFLPPPSYAIARTLLEQWVGA